MDSYVSRFPATVILGLPFSTATAAQLLDTIEEIIASRSQCFVAPVNLDGLVWGMRDRIFKRITYGAGLVTPDGMPVVWAGRVLRPKLTERVAGSDFTPLLLARAARKGYSVFFLGGQEGVAELAAEKCGTSWPGLRIAGTYSPPFVDIWEMDTEDIVGRINLASPDILLLALGNPKQERWLSKNSARLSTPIAISAGATIDFLAGKVSRAPAWMKSAGAEWIFRIWTDPRRLARRYVMDIGMGLVPLVLQVLADSTVRVLVRESNAGGPDGLQFERLTVSTHGGQASALFLGHCRKPLLSLLAARMDALMDPDVDALILDLTDIPAVDSDVISLLVAIDQYIRRKMRNLILITTRLTALCMRIARIEDMFTMVRTKGEALATLRTMGKRSLLCIVESPRHDTHVVVLRGELTNDSAPLIEETCATMFTTTTALVVDLMGVTSVDAGGIGKLLDLWERTRGDGCPMHCVVSDRSLAGELRARGLRKSIMVHKSREDALRSATMGASPADV